MIKVPRARTHETTYSSLPWMDGWPKMNPDKLVKMQLKISGKYPTKRSPRAHTNEKQFSPLTSLIRFFQFILSTITGGKYHKSAAYETSDSPLLSPDILSVKSPP